MSFSVFSCLTGEGEDEANVAAEISAAQLADLQIVFHEIDNHVVETCLECILGVKKAQYLLLASVYELESEVIDTLRSKFSFPIYSVGPAIPYFELDNTPPTTNDNLGSNYLQWLDKQPCASVLYISLGSFLSVSNSQTDEIVAGLQKSGIRFLWVARGEASRLKESCGEMGLVVPWCHQFRVLSHPSVGGFWTHCGWNSTLEAVFSGVPMLTFPLFLDQVPNSRQIVDDWKIGWRVKRSEGGENLVTRDQISLLVQRFMDPNNDEAVEMRRRAREIQNVCQKAVDSSGSSQSNLDDFIRNLSNCNTELSCTK